jgi:hypothetical protein
MSKKVDFTPKPSREAAKEAWVASREVPTEKRPTKRLTLDIDAELHQRVRVACARDGVIMADMLRELLEKRFPPDKKA